jgi:hypothetical protein
MAGAQWWNIGNNGFNKLKQWLGHDMSLFLMPTCR